MNAWKLNSRAGHYYQMMIIKHLNIFPTDIYKHVKSIDHFGDITLHDGRRFRPELKEII